MMPIYKRRHPLRNYLLSNPYQNKKLLSKTINIDVDCLSFLTVHSDFLLLQPTLISWSYSPLIYIFWTDKIEWAQMP